MFKKIVIYIIRVMVITVVFSAGSRNTLQAKSVPQFYDNALKKVEAETEQFPYTYQGRLRLGNHLARNEYYDLAVKVYDRILSDNPGNPDVLLMRGRAHGWNRNYYRAREDLRTVIEKNPKYPDAWQILGNVYRWSNRSDSAVSAYTKWIQLQPERPEPYLHRGRIYRNLGKYELAKDDLRIARKKGAEPDQLTPAQPEASDANNSDYNWQASSGYRRTDLSRGRSNWTRYNAVVEKTVDWGSVGLEAFRAEHFNTWNSGIVMDAYRNLDGGQYINMRYQTSPEHDFLASHDVLVEGYQSLGYGWEGSLGLRTMDFDNNDVEIRKVGLARYWGPYYGRLVLREVEDNSSSGNFSTLKIRRYLNGSDNFIEIRGGKGDEVVEVSRLNPAGTLDTELLGARYKFFVDSKNGIDLNVNYIAPQGQAIRRSATIEYLRRWE